MANIGKPQEEIIVTPKELPIPSKMPAMPALPSKPLQEPVPA